MNYARRWVTAGLVAMMCALGACASLPESVISPPEVTLRDVEIVGLGFNNQTFLLSFDIKNPNPFTLPIKHVRYGVKLDGQRFASGETPSKISVPASRSSEFAISVELDLLATAPKLLSILRSGVRGEIPYALDGELGIDLPLTPPVAYRTEGTISLDTSDF